MGRHSMGYVPPGDDFAVFSADGLSADASIAPPGDPIEPGVPGAPEAPNPNLPGPDAPSTVPVEPVEPPPLAPEEPDDGSVPAPGEWHAAGPEVI